MKIVLASSSPRRQQLLSPLLPGLEIVHPRLSEDVPDSVQDVENARKIAEGLALHKARDVLGSAGLEEDVVIIGADTIVVCDGKILGKPLSPEEAFEMLFSLSGRGHDVITGVAVVSAKAQYAASCCTRVFFKELDARTIKDYTASTEPFDKAGAYGIQGAGGELVDRIEGSWSNVVGLPLQTLADLLNNFGVVFEVDSGPIILVTGMPGAGKEEFVRASRKRLYAVIRMGDVVRAEAMRAGLREGDMSIGGFANDQRKLQCPEIWAIRTMEKMADMDASKVLIDGTRSLAEISHFRKMLGKRVVLVSITASAETRYQRLVARGRSDAPGSLKDFVAREEREKGWGILEALGSADFTLGNDGSLEDFHREADRVLESIETHVREVSGHGGNAY